MSSNDAETMRCAIELTLRWNARRELIVDGPERYDGARLERESAAFATALHAAGAGRRDRVVFVGPSTGRFFAAWLGAQRLGCTTCNVHLKETAHFVSRTFATLAPKAVVCADAILPVVLEALRAQGSAASVFTLGDATPPGASACYRDVQARCAGTPVPQVDAIAPEDPAIVVLSSGSTGDPKAVLHGNASFVRWMRAAPALFGAVDRNTRFLVIVGTSFAAWGFSAISMLYAGGTLVLMDGFTPERFCQLAQSEKVTMAGPVPTMIRMLVPEITREYDLSSFRMMLCAGEPPSPVDIQRILSWADTDIRCLYLASESAPGAATFWELRDQTLRGKAVCAGLPVPGADLRIVDPDGGIDDLRPSGESGEILLRGPTLAQGYLGNPALTAARFVDGWWRSGDLGHLDADGYLHVAGRTDNTINSGGIKVQAEEVELCLMECAGVVQAAVIGVPDPRWGQRIEAHVVAVDGTGEDLLRNHCRQHLAAFKQPKSYVFHAKLPTGATGKLDRVGLRRRHAVAPAPGDAPPASGAS